MTASGGSDRIRNKRNHAMLWQLAVPISVISGIAYLSIPDESALLWNAPQGGVDPVVQTTLDAESASVSEAIGNPSESHNANASAREEPAATEKRRPLRMTRSRYRTLTERCDLGIADPGIRCSNGPSGIPILTGTADDGPDDAAGYRISGRVSAHDGFGIAGVSLVASRMGFPGATASERMAGEPGGFRRYQAITRDDGSYTFDDIAEGSYRIQTARHGAYVPMRITARTGVDYADIVLSEQQAYLVEGIVTDVSGSPLGHVSVLPVVEGVPSVRTDRGGRYRMPVWLPAGARRLTLRFEAPGFSQQQRAVSMATAAAAPGTDELSRLRLDATLEPIELTTNVRGTVRTSEGAPIRGQVVELRSAAGQQRYRAVSDRAGKYEFSAIPAPKTYQMRIDGHPGHPDYRADVAVTSQNFEFDIITDPFDLGKLRGRIVNSDGAPVPDIELAVRNTRLAQNSAMIRSDSTGSFLVDEMPAGETLLASEAMPAVLVRGIEVRAGGESAVDVVIDWGKHQLTGVVVDRRGIAIPASDVLLKWSRRSDDGVTSSVTRRTSTDYLGRFGFDHLGPGPHSIVVGAEGFETVAIQHEIRRDGYDVTVRLH
jgi:hypothetical protein